MKMLLSIMSNLETHYRYQLDFQKSRPTCRKQVVNPRHQKPQEQLVTNPETPMQYIPVETLNMTYKCPKVACSIQYSNNVQGQKHQWVCFIAEPELHSHKKPRCVVQT